MLLALKEESSRLGKELLLGRLTEIEKRVFLYTYNPYYMYRHKQVGKVRLSNLGEPKKPMFELLDKIRKGELSGGLALRAILQYAEANGDLIKLIVKKNLGCGCTSTTINKIWPGFVPQFKVQLAKEAPIDSLKYPLLAQLKYDGVRLIVLVKEGRVKFRTRNGKEVELPRLGNIVTRNFNSSNFVLDTEVTLVSGKVEDRTTVSGMINSAMHGGVVDEGLLKLNVFDGMSIDEWEFLECGWKYTSRLKLISSVAAAIDNPQIELAQTIVCKDTSEVSALYESKIAEGYEGLVLKQADHLYTFKRTKDWAKLKETKSVELECVGVIEGKGKYEGMIGALQCRGRAEGELVNVKVGTGLSDLERSLDYSCFESETIEVEYNSVIKDTATGSLSLFLPRFISIRCDK
jgi:DNA ligase-1